MSVLCVYLDFLCLNIYGQEYRVHAARIARAKVFQLNDSAPMKRRILHAEIQRCGGEKRRQEIKSFI